MSINVQDLLRVGQRALDELRREHGIDDGHGSGDPPTAEQLAAYIGALEDRCVAFAMTLAAQKDGIRL